MIIRFFHLNRRKKHHTYLVLWEKNINKACDITEARGTQVKKIIVRHHTGQDDECVVKSPITASFSLLKAFALIDADGDGCITSQELITVIEKVIMKMIRIMAMTGWWNRLEAAWGLTRLGVWSGRLTWIRMDPLTFLSLKPCGHHSRVEKMYVLSDLTQLSNWLNLTRKKSVMSLWSMIRTKMGS